MMVKERNYGIDLLRLLLMFMICMLHTLGQGGILHACEAGTPNYKFYWFLEIISYCAVDGFAIISGYMAANRHQRYEKLAEMWFQAFFYSFVVSFILIAAGINENFTKTDIIKCAFPLLFNKFWYFTAFFALFFAVPLLNKFIFGIDDILAKKALIIFIILFSFVGIVSDSFESKYGYSAIWLIVLYCVGALAKKIKLFETKKSPILIIWWTCCVVLTWAIHVYIGIGRLTNYISPTILLSGITMVILFSRLHLKGTVISKLSPLTFGIYLFHTNQVIWNNIIKDRFAFVAKENIVIGAVYVFTFASLIFVFGLAAEFIWSKIAVRLKIPSLSKRIVETADKHLIKLFVFLK